MCFSATASFGVSAVLLPAGAYCIRAAVRKNRAYIPLAAIPLIFGVQQFCEGLVWFGIDHRAPSVVTPAALLYLFFAIAFWLCWVPLSFMSIEPRKNGRIALAVIAAAGFGYGACLYVPIALDPASHLSVTIDYHSVQYGCRSLELFRSVPEAMWLTAYMAIVFAPLVISGHRHFRAFAISLAIAAAISHVFFWYAFVSVWCFFAAVLSVQIAFILHAMFAPVARTGLYPR